jgi:hypothetical protein
VILLILRHHVFAPSITSLAAAASAKDKAEASAAAAATSNHFLDHLFRG